MQRRDFLKLSSLATVAPMVFLPQESAANEVQPPPKDGFSLFYPTKRIEIHSTPEQDRMRKLADELDIEVHESPSKIYGPNCTAPYKSHSVNYDEDDCIRKTDSPYYYYVHFPIDLHLEIEYLEEDDTHWIEDYQTFINRDTTLLLGQLQNIDSSELFDDAKLNTTFSSVNNIEVYDLNICGHTFMLCSVTCNKWAAKLNK